MYKRQPILSAPRLVPDDWGAKHWNHYGPKQKTVVGKGINLFECVFIDEQNDLSIIGYKPHPLQPLRQLTEPALSQVKDAKMHLWKSSGYLSHSDAALWASKILAHKDFGGTIRQELIHRFPLIIVDELQDTGYFLGKSIRLLLDEPLVRGVLVGDPDQAIFEFNGARPDLFAGFEAIGGAVILPLSNSQRCPSSIITVAAHLKDTDGDIGSENSKCGQTLLIRYVDMTADVLSIVKALEIKKADILKVVARRKDTVDTLRGNHIKQLPKLGSPPLNHISRAVILFRTGRQSAARKAVLAALEIMIFQHEGISIEDLKKCGVEENKWNKLATDCLLDINSLEITNTLYDWEAAAGTILHERISNLGLDPDTYVQRKLTLKKLKGWNDDCVDYLVPDRDPPALKLAVPIQTIHGVKGETHDVTILVCPETGINHCPSQTWWSQEEKDREEKRIAYVAMTRTQRDLIVCVSEACYERLCRSREEFVNSFNICMTVEEFIASRIKI